MFLLFVNLLLLHSTRNINKNHHEVSIHKILMDTLKNNTLIETLFNLIDNKLNNQEIQEINSITCNKDDSMKSYITFINIDSEVLMCIHTKGLDVIDQSKPLHSNMRYLECNGSSLIAIFEGISSLLSRLVERCIDDYEIYINLDLVGISKKKIMFLKGCLHRLTCMVRLSYLDTCSFIESRLGISEIKEQDVDDLVLRIIIEVFNSRNLFYSKKNSILKIVYDFVFVNRKSFKKFVSDMIKNKEMLPFKSAIHIKIIKKIMNKNKDEILMKHRKHINKFMDKYCVTLKKEISVMYSKYIKERIYDFKKDSEYQISSKEKIEVDSVINDLVSSCMLDSSLIGDNHRMKNTIDESIRNLLSNYDHNLNKYSKICNFSRRFEDVFRTFVISEDPCINKVSYKIVNSILKRSKKNSYYDEGYLKEIIPLYIINLYKLIETRIKIYLTMISIVNSGNGDEFLDSFKQSHKKSKFLVEFFLIRDRLKKLN